MKDADDIFEECDWVTHLGPKDIVNMICNILEKDTNLIETNKNQKTYELGYKVKEDTTNIRYVHKLAEDVGDTLKAGIILHSLSNPNKLNQYSAWNGVGFSSIPPEKVKVYKISTRTMVEELVEELTNQQN